MLGIFLDSETNGLNPYRHKILEIGLKIVDVSTGVLKEEFTAVITTTPAAWQQSDPESLKVNGFKWSEVSQGISNEKAGEEIIALFSKHQIKRGKAVFICQNPSFDRIFFSQLVDPDLQEKLLWPYHWLDLASMYWAKAIENPAKGFPWETGVSKDKIAVALQLPREEQPHRAMNGVNHLLLCYEAVVGFPEEEK